jgi:hypothetical protein
MGQADIAPPSDQIAGDGQDGKRWLWWAIATLLLTTVSSFVTWRSSGEKNPHSFAAAALGWGVLWALATAGVIFGPRALAKINAEKAEAKRQRAQALAAAEAERTKQFYDFFSHPLQAIQSPLVLKKNETCYWTGSVECFSLHKHSYRTGTYGGPSFRVARGLYWRAGGFRSAPVSTQAMESDGKGSLYLTNLRLVFVGAAKSAEFPFAKIASVEPFSDGIQVNIVNKSPVILVSGDYWLYVFFNRVRDGVLDAVPDAQMPDELKSMTPST